LARRSAKHEDGRGRLPRRNLRQQKKPGKIHFSMDLARQSPQGEDGSRATNHHSTVNSTSFPFFSLPGNFTDFMKSPKRIPEKSNLLLPIEPF